MIDKEIKKLKGIIFDLDGTLTDSLPGIVNSLNNVLKHNGFPHISAEKCKSIIGHGVENLVKSALPENTNNPELLSHLVAQMKEEYKKHALEGTTLYPFIPEFLDHLKCKGIRFFLLSNKHESAVSLIYEKQLKKWDFEQVIGGSDQRMLKPDPSAVFQILDKSGLAKSEICLVGDGETDILTAKNAGILSVAVSWGYRTKEFLHTYNPDLLIDHPDEMEIMMGISKG